MQQNLVGLAFAAGLVAALNPCGFALLPAYLTLVVRGEATSQLAALGRALAATAAMALGFVAVFATFGLLAVPVASTVQRNVPYVTVLIGIVLVSLGGWLLAGRRLAVLIPLSLSSRWKPGARMGSMFAYGAGYALASLSCTVGPFLAVTGASFRNGTIAGGLQVYLAYAGGMATAGVLAVAVAFARSTLIERMLRIVRYVNSISAVLLVLAGVYVGYFGIYEVRLFYADSGPGDPTVAAAGRVQGTVAQWVHQHGAWPWLLTGVALVAGAALASVWRRRGRERLHPPHAVNTPVATTRAPRWPRARRTSKQKHRGDRESSKRDRGDDVAEERTVVADDGAPNAGLRRGTPPPRHPTPGGAAITLPRS